MQYTLTLKYSKTPDGYLTVNVKVREYESAHDDSFTFSPQPTLTGTDSRSETLRDTISTR